ncbi:testis-expressed sequence 2 protein-like [Dorcoceras hygrometricum]|uniref:Testis-expressed sequence 2 protein-like n=1 Tax=Dorcoceras hygrometricum TaxID=472368 RepID=A0A2Z7DG96_9LAMI|nr:testis-expressed sequence 2 protein-like [Dorcoceras hygrometricum]
MVQVRQLEIEQKVKLEISCWVLGYYRWKPLLKLYFSIPACSTVATGIDKSKRSLSVRFIAFFGRVVLRFREIALQQLNSSGPSIRSTTGISVPSWFALENQRKFCERNLLVEIVRTNSNGITSSAFKNQLVMVSVQYGPFNSNIPIESTIIGKSRVARYSIATHTSWRSNSDIACATREHCDVLSMQMDSDLVIYQTTLVRTFQVVTICRVDKSEVLVVLIIPQYSKYH